MKIQSLEVLGFLNREEITRVEFNRDLNMLSEAERLNFDAELDHFLDWFSNQIHSLQTGMPYVLRDHPNKILAEQRPAVVNPGLRQTIAANYPRLLRGHALFALLLRQITRTGRGSQYNDLSLMEVGALRTGIHYRAIEAWLVQELP